MRRSQAFGLLLSLSIAIGCNRAPTAAPIASSVFVPPAHAGALTFLALGDSYTIGEGLPPSDRWPVQLAATLRQSGVDLADPAILARTGWTTEELLLAMDNTPLASRYDLVTLMIGVNNQFRGEALSGYRRDLQTLLDRSIALAGGRADHVVVLSIPDWGVSPFGKQAGGGNVSADIDQFNASCRELSEAVKVQYVDVTAISRADAGQADRFADDGLHPSASQCEQWMDAALMQVKTALAMQ